MDILVPFLDYDTHIKDLNGNPVDPTRAIFVFLTNSGGSSILKQMLKMWELKKLRKEAVLGDFEKQLELIMFNERGGFYKSDTIESSLIDHYVPFLPLERKHVEKCAIDAFKRRGVDPDDHQLKEVMKGLSFGPEPHDIYSEGGCKRLDQKVGSIIQSRYFSDLSKSNKSFIIANYKILFNLHNTYYYVTIQLILQLYIFVRIHFLLRSMLNYFFSFNYVFFFECLPHNSRETKRARDAGNSTWYILIGCQFPREVLIGQQSVCRLCEWPGARMRVLFH